MKSLELERFEAGITNVLPKNFKEFVELLENTHFKHLSENYRYGEQKRLNDIKKYFGNYNLHQIQPGDVQAFLHFLLDNNLSTKTVRNYFGLLSLIFRQAKLRCYVTELPTEAVKPPAVVARREVSALSEFEIEKTLHHADKAVRDIILLLIHTGMRFGELQRVRVERDVDFAANVLRIRSVEGAVTKNKKPRVIPLTPVARTIFEKIKVGPVWTATLRVFDHQLRKLAQVTGIKLHAHRFRHTFCSLNMSRGVPNSVVEAWLGHGSSQITKRYTHLSGYDQQWAKLDVGMKKVGQEDDQKIG